MPQTDPQRRIKSYTAQSGIVYEYAFARSRRARIWWRAGTEYAFEIRLRRAGSVTVKVFLGDRPVREWEKRRGRQLSDAEKYALAKMSLFAAFDEQEDRIASERRVVVTAQQVAAALASLDIT